MELVIDMCRYFQNEINKVGASNMLLISTNTLLLCSYVEMVFFYLGKVLRNGDFRIKFLG